MLNKHTQINNLNIETETQYENLGKNNERLQK